MSKAGKRRRRLQSAAVRAPSPACADGAEEWRGPRRAVVFAALLTVAALAGVAGWALRHPAPRPVAAGLAADPGRTPEYARDIAPLMDAHCAGCHHAGTAAPFSLLTYADTCKHSKEIADVTRRRVMPPWLPDPSCTNFADARLLSEAEIGLVLAWVAGGMPEGDPARRPAPPQWADGWRLGVPDLVVTMPQAYSVPAEGGDLYRNFVFPIPGGARRFVRGVEFRPGNPRVVHHAFFQIDATRESRRLAEAETPPGFEGFHLPPTAVMPGGQLLGWQPGKEPYLGEPGLAWPLSPGCDAVLQLHLHPTGKPETVQSSVGFYFTDEPPTNAPYRIELVRYDLDIPANSDSYAVESAYDLPVDVRLLRISPHTHFLGKRLESWATLPDGARLNLLLIKDWNFNWQGDYRYLTPVHLPKGTRVSMRYQFDNTTNNVRNPSHPPKRVAYGLQSTDEMAELWLQVLPVAPSDRKALAADFLHYHRGVLIEDYRAKLLARPSDADLHLKLGAALRDDGRDPEALPHLAAAVELRPGDEGAHYELGSCYLNAGRLELARAQFESAVKLDPRDGQAFGKLGIIALREHKAAESKAEFEEALRVNPDDTIARGYLEKLTAAGY